MEKERKNAKIEKKCVSENIRELDMIIFIRQLYWFKFSLGEYFAFLALASQKQEVILKTELGNTFHIHSSTHSIALHS